MSDPGHHLQRWQEAGLIDKATVSRITAYEATHAEPRPTASEAVRPSVLEAVAYLGFAVLAVGAYVFAAQRWDALASAARLAVVGVPAAVALAAGAAMLREGEPGVRRGGEVAWLVCVALFAGLAAVALEEYGPGAGDSAGLVVNGLATFVLALALWALVPSHPQVVALGGATFFLGMAIAAAPDDFDPRPAGMVMFAMGVAALALTEAGLLRPRSSARLVFAALTAWGPYFAGLDGSVIWAELMVFAVGAALAALGVGRGSFAYLAAGVAALFAGLVTFLFEHFDEELGAPVALMISGAALIAAVLILARLRAAQTGGMAA